MPATRCPRCQTVLLDREQGLALCPICSQSLTPQRPPGSGGTRRLRLVALVGLVAVAVVAGLVWFRGDVGGVRVKSQPKPEQIGTMPQEEGDDPVPRDRPKPLPPPRVAE
jgi:hypothetical protein